MLVRKTAENGVVYLASPRLLADGVPHAFSTRIGGVSSAPFHSLNLGRHNHDSPQDSIENLRANFRLFQAAINADRLPLAWLKQVHGANVELLHREGESEYAETLSAELTDRFNGQTAGDALISDQPGILLCIRTADCLPILLSGPHGRLVAAVHAGWRGLVANVLTEAVRTMSSYGVHPTAIHAVVGPGIGPSAFEVSEGVASEFERIGLLDAVVPADVGGKPHINLPLAAKMQLQAAGVVSLEVAADCTWSDKETFFSHRRDGPSTGRMAAVIAAVSQIK